ncbi:MAG: phospholipase D-like domain-containing protein [Marmoricola sp.]
MAAVATAVVLAGAVLAPGASAADTAAPQWEPVEGGLFNIARSTPSEENRLEDQVVAAINHARRDSTIAMAMFSFDRDRVAQALIKAHRQRHVHVRVIVNGHEYPHAQRLMNRAFGHTRSKRNFFYQCKASCRGQGDVQHSKFVLFSHTGGARDVVMLGSLNMKLNGVQNQFNDLLTLNGHTRLFDALTQVFEQMKLDRLAHPSYLQEQVGAGQTLYVLPFPKPPAATRRTKWTASRDPISQILAPIHCFGARTNSGRTIVRVNMHAWDGARGAMLARRFRDLYAAGCDVKLQVGFAGGQVRQIFATPTKRGYVPIRSTGFDTDEDGEIDLYSHEKILTVNGHYGSRPGRKMVVTGSSNYQNGGQYGDEIIFRYFNSAIYRQYADNWGYMWVNHTHGFGFEPASATPNARAMRPTLTDGLGTNSPEWRDE